MARPGRQSLRILRFGMLLAFLGSLLAVVYLLVLRRPTGLSGVDGVRAVDAAGAEAGLQEAAVVAEGFERIFMQEGRRLFAIVGDRLLADREDNVFLEGVQVEFARPDGEVVIDSDRAEYNQAEGQARLEGNVVVTTPDGLKLFTDWLELEQQGNLLETSRGTRFEMGELVGSATNFRADFAEDTLVLSGGVQVNSREGVEPALRLKAQRVAFRQTARLARAQGKVVLRRGADELRCERLSLYLDSVEDSVRFVRALWKVRGVVSSSSADLIPGLDLEQEPSARSGQARFRGASLAVTINRRGEIETLDLEGVRKTPAVFAGEEQDGARRRISAAGIRVSFRDNQAQAVDALGDVELVEDLPGDGSAVDAAERRTRQAQAETLHAELDRAGRLALAELDGGVRLSEGDLIADAAQARMLLIQDQIELIGAPEVSLSSEEGDLVAPTVLFNQKTGLLQARGGVRSELSSNNEAAARAPLGQGDEPIRVESREALLRRGSSEFLFRHGVRAWSGSTLLFADQLRGNSEGTQLSASGSVRSVLQPRRDEGAVGESEAAGQVEVRADLLTYDGASSDLLYEGNVVAQDSGREIRCSQLAVKVDDRQEPDEMLCSGGAKILDPGSQRKIEGDRATYDLSSSEVVLHGEPLTLDDPGVGRVTGYRLWFSMESGLFKLGEVGGTTSTSP